jgi:tungstate transport system substrate-binding protein
MKNSLTPLINKHLFAIVLIYTNTLLPHAAHAQRPPGPLVMASTTSTEQSGLFAHLLPAFKRDTGLDIYVVALGTGQALDMARRGDADVVFVHDPAAEDAFVAQGWGLKRQPVMYNDFVLVGPKTDPLRLAGSDVAGALRTLAQAQAPFVSRGDHSGTHAAELRFWAMALNPAAAPDPATPKSRGYQACGCGMGPALNMAAALGAYTLSDRGTWLNFKNRGDLAILVQGDQRLFNPYGVIVVNPARHPHVKHAQAQRFADWVTSPAGQGTIASYRINGEPLFFPNAQAQAPVQTQTRGQPPAR